MALVNILLLPLLVPVSPADTHYIDPTSINPTSLAATSVFASTTGSIAESQLLAHGSLNETAAKVFQDFGVEGAFLLYDERRDQFYRYNPSLTRKRLIPASTFKILNSLIILDYDIVDDVERELIEWDGVERQFESWNQDQSLRSAFRRSAVWAYQKLAREVGQERMQSKIDAVGFGEGTVDEDADQFWLDGSLRISPEEQIQFLRRLFSEDLPFRGETMAAVKDIMVIAETDAFRLSGKTGLALSEDPTLGWFVGYLEVSTRDEPYFFALTVEVTEQSAGMRRVPITTEIFKDLGLISRE